MKTSLPHILLAVSASAILPSSATVVWMDDFSVPRTPAGGTSLPNSYSYDDDGVGDYSIRSANTVSIPAGGYLSVQDSTSTQSFSALVTTSQWSFLPQEGEQIVFSYSIRITNLTAATAASVPRFGLVQDSTGTDLHNGGGSIFNIGFSYANFDGVAGTEMAFYTTADVTSVPAGNAIGYSSGGGWVDGFNFGAYTAGSSSTIPVYAGAPTDAQWYHVRIVVTEGSNALSGTITQDGTSNVASFSRTLGTTVNLNDLTNSNDGFRIYMGDSGSANADFDNFQVEIIPEPSSSVAFGFSGIALALIRRRKAATT